MTCGRSPVVVGKAAARRRAPSGSYAAVHALADRMRPRAARAFLASVARVRSALSLEEIEGAAATGDAAAVNGALDRVLGRGAFAPLGALAVELAAASAEDEAPRVAAALARRGVEFGGRFDMLNPRTVDHLRRYRFDLVSRVSAETVEGIRDVVLRSFREAHHPREMAREIRDMIGLTSRQSRAVASYRAALEEGRLDEAFARRRADHRFRATPDAARTDEMVGRYAERMLAYRAETVARTETIRASMAGKDALWRQALDEGELPADRTRRVWIVTPDDRLCPICESIPDLNPDGVPVGGMFRAEGRGGEFLVEYPPAHPSCRCAIGLTFVEPSAATVGVVGEAA